MNKMDLLVLPRPMPDFPDADASSPDNSQSSPPELGGTGDPPVPVGDPPTGTEQDRLLPSTVCKICLLRHAKDRLPKPGLGPVKPGKTKSLEFRAG